VPGASIVLLQLDLASLTSVRNAASKFLDQSSRLDVLFNNGGIMSVPPALTSDGYEIQFGTNHIGHALLTRLLLPTLLKTAEDPGTDVRIVTLGSSAHTLSPKGGIVFETLRTAQVDLGKLTLYGQSKLANMLYSSELACRYPSITAVAVHPGQVSETGLSRSMRESHLIVRVFEATIGRVTGVSVEQGAHNQLWAATSSEVESGAYYEPVGKKAAGSTVSRDKRLAQRLWEWTEEQFNGK
jgi:retinol dehydrogenase 12